MTLIQTGAFRADNRALPIGSPIYRAYTFPSFLESSLPVGGYHSSCKKTAAGFDFLNDVKLEFLHRESPRHEVDE